MSRLIGIVTWIGPAVTFLAVVVALLRDEIRSIWKRPNLCPAIKLSAPDCHKTWITYTDKMTGAVTAQGDCYYLRLWVENRGRLRAEKVQVFLSKVKKQLADGSFRPVKAFLPMNLRWAHSQPGNASPEIFADGISPGMGKHCDLGHVLHPLLRAQVKETLPEASRDKIILSLDLEVQPSTLSHLLLPGVYRLEVKIGAANARPVTRSFELNLTGEWFDNEERMFADGIGVK
jgi:hypothetical protein